MINITDGNNYARRLFETDPTGMAYRKALRDVQFSTDVEIWVWDGFHANRRRREYYPQYKMRRTQPGEDMFKSMKLLADVLTHSNAIQISVPTYEADDVIACLCRRLAGRIHVRSTDRDFLQLVDPEGRVTVDATPKTGVEASQTLLYKICVGDASDNITGIKGFGEVAWKNVDKQALRSFISELIEFKEPLDVEVPGLTANQRKWMLENADMIRTYNTIINFFDIPQAEIDANLRVGDRNYAAADAKLKEFFL